MSDYRHYQTTNQTSYVTPDFEFYVDKWLQEGFSIMQINNVVKYSRNLQEADRILQSTRTPSQYEIEFD